MIVYNCYLHELFILQSYIFLSEKRKKSKNLHSLVVFLLKSYKR